MRFFLGFGTKSKDPRNEHCTVCMKELTGHKYKPSPDWNLHGLLCSDCHIEKTRDFILRGEEEKRRELEHKEREDRTCDICNNVIALDADKKKPEWKWNMDTVKVLCSQCYETTEADFNRKLNFCALCDIKMGFIRYNPKPKWRIDGQLCRRCWDEQNSKSKNANR